MRASLIAESTASEPLLVKKTLVPSAGARPATSSASSSAGSLVKGSKQENAATLTIWSRTASAISTRPYPTLQYQRLAMPSM